MSGMKRKIEEIQESANTAFEAYVSGGETPDNPYAGQYAQLWNDTISVQIVEYNNWLDDIAEINYFQNQAEDGVVAF